MKHIKTFETFTEEAIEGGLSSGMTLQDIADKHSVDIDQIQKELEADTNLADAFLKFSPYKQYEFLEYIETAKREETKLSRIEKIKPMIKDNIGLNDKYR